MKIKQQTVVNRNKTSEFRLFDLNFLFALIIHFAI